MLLLEGGIRDQCDEGAGKTGAARGTIQHEMCMSCSYIVIWRLMKNDKYVVNSWEDKENVQKLSRQSGSVQRLAVDSSHTTLHHGIH